MSQPMDEKPPPKPTDLEGWRQAIHDGSFRTLRLEAIVAAIQDLGPRTDKAVLNPLAKHLSDTMLKMLRGWVGFHHPNQGHDLIDRVHAQAWDKLLQPHCPDGKGYRNAFGARLKYRLKDAIALEARALRDSEHDLAESQRAEALAEDDAVKFAEEERNVESVLQLVKDDRKRLAFRLHMEDVPCKSSRSYSIAQALGIDERTARQWVKEVQSFLQSKLGGNP